MIPALNRKSSLKRNYLFGLSDSSLVDGFPAGNKMRFINGTIASKSNCRAKGERTRVKF